MQLGKLKPANARSAVVNPNAVDLVWLTQNIKPQEDMPVTLRRRGMAAAGVLGYAP